MDHRIIPFRCVECGTNQQTEVTWQPATQPSPVKGNKAVAEVTCPRCGKVQIVPVPPDKR